MTSIATYEVVFVLPDCTVITRTMVGARSAHNRIHSYPPTTAVFGMRYYPSRKAWLVFALKDKRPPKHVGGQYIPPPAPKVFETSDKDAAIMWSVLNLNV